MSSSHTGRDTALCNKCRTLPFLYRNLVAVTLVYQYLPGIEGLRRRLVNTASRKVFVALGPYHDTIDKTTCAFCRIARHAVELHDSHPTHVLLVCWRQGFWHIERHTRAQEDLAHYDQRTNIYWQTLHREWGSYNEVERYSAHQAVRQARLWLSKCSTSQSVDPCCRRSQEGSRDHGMTFTHIIDVYKRKVVKMTQLSTAARSKPYFALSYVNGGAQFLKLTHDNESDLCRHGSLSKDKIARTFEEAIVFTRRCKVRYLWIDALCIFQDDDDDVQIQIEKMGDVYQYALLVLIAQLGNSPHFGLFPRSFPNAIVRGQSFYSHHGGSKGTTYHTRAWCYQEQHLARRTLTFGAATIFYRCGRLTESAWKFGQSQRPLTSARDNNPASISLKSVTKFRNLQDPDAEGTTSHELLSHYSSLVGDYLERSLTYNNDIERAFRGVSELIANGTNAPVFHGLPSALFPMCLFWAIAEGSRRLGADCSPSWSWTSLQMPVRLLQKRAIPLPRWRLFGAHLATTRYFLVGTRDCRMATSSFTAEHREHHTVIDVVEQFDLAEGAIESLPKVCVASGRCRTGQGTLHFQALALPTQSFLVDTKRMRGSGGDFDTLHHRSFAGNVAGIAYGIEHSSNPWKDTDVASKQQTFFVPTAVTDGKGIDIKIRRSLMHDHVFEGPYYMSLILLQEQDSVTCTRIGLAAIKSSVFDSCGPEQKLIHLV